MAASLPVAAAATPSEHGGGSGSSSLGLSPELAAAVVPKPSVPKAPEPPAPKGSETQSSAAAQPEALRGEHQEVPQVAHHDAVCSADLTKTTTDKQASPELKGQSANELVPKTCGAKRSAQVAAERDADALSAHSDASQQEIDLLSLRAKAMRSSAAAQRQRQATADAEAAADEAALQLAEA